MHASVKTLTIKLTECRALMGSPRRESLVVSCRAAHCCLVERIFQAAANSWVCNSCRNFTACFGGIAVSRLPHYKAATVEMALNAFRSKFPVDGDQGSALTLLFWCKVVVDVNTLTLETDNSLIHYSLFHMAGSCFYQDTS